MTIAEPITQCQKCGSPVWDNRETKKNPKGPDFKCKASDCQEAYWLDTKASSPKKSVAVAPEPKSQPLHNPGYSWAELGLTYKKCHKLAVWAMGSDMSPEAIQAATATLFIQAMKQGMKVVDPTEGFDDMPDALKEAFEPAPWDEK